MLVDSLITSSQIGQVMFHIDFFSCWFGLSLDLGRFKESTAELGVEEASNHIFDNVDHGGNQTYSSSLPDSFS